MGRVLTLEDQVKKDKDVSGCMYMGERVGSELDQGRSLTLFIAVAEERPLWHQWICPNRASSSYLPIHSSVQSTRRERKVIVCFFDARDFGM